MSNGKKWAAIIAAGLVCTSCGMLSPEQQDAALRVVDNALASGGITEHEHAVMRDAILSQGWGGLIDKLTSIGLAAVAAWTGIRIQRGPPTRRENVAKAKAAKLPAGT